MKKPKIYSGDVKKDKRGNVKFVNDFLFKKVKRFYVIENTNNEPRAFHGHFKEEKYVYVITGKILLCIVKIDDPYTPSKNRNVQQFVLSSDTPQILYIPSGYANGFKVLRKETKVIFFSTLTLKQSLKDDYRYPHNYWGENIWKKEQK